LLAVIIYAPLSNAEPYDQLYDRARAPNYDQTGYGVMTLEERVAKLEKQLSGSTLMEMLKNMERLQGEVLKLRGEFEEVSHELETLKKQQRDLYTDLDQRLQAGTGGNAGQQAVAPSTESGEAATATGDSSAAPPSPPQTQAPPQSGSDQAGRQAAYQKAFNVLKEGEYAGAIKEFKNFLSVYPSGAYTDNATYWLAEAYYVNRDFPTARDAFRKLIKEFPQSSKVPDALLKIGYIEYDTAQYANAKELLTDVMKRYPGTSAAKLAEKRLEKIQQEKR
jgi:tol-pal system protein YbgF